MSALLIIGVLLIGAVGVYICWIEPRRFRLRRETICIRELPVPKLRFLHLSDLHLRRRSDYKLTFLETLADIPFDFLLLTGDIIDSPEGIDYCQRLLDILKPRYASFAVLGAHDHYDCTFKDFLQHLAHFKTSREMSIKNPTEKLTRALSQKGVTVLVNDSRVFELGSSSITFIGLDDPFIFRHDLDASLRGTNQSEFRILLVHAPDIPNEIASREINLVFAGHTHGGQVRLPFLGAVVTRCCLDRTFASGTFQIGETVFHINNGIGAGKFTDFRFLCTPEASLVEVVRQKNDNRSA